MSGIKITWLGLRNNREKLIWADAFRTGVDAGERMKEEVRGLARDIGTQERIQSTPGEAEEGCRMDGLPGSDGRLSGREVDARVSENISRVK
ncbi:MULTISPECIES: hypothetical protein [unclassified Dehalobacter]|jgi:hypothetical protein|uniref:hypothetical protein n=1 Tax=unclassified Dehalobacter TaxID=2635733 RepID=UPI00028A6A7E|nr:MULTISPECIES: hypothetical protein [unclassified Dehalobacter]AFV02833.1 hypothetical protein DHBDCA_p1807 [Dehalobacter sp. DCA]AFV05820.1 hypothetical protein DCF50_p1818 [Dehalobacter sp. CF]